MHCFGQLLTQLGLACLNQGEFLQTLQLHRVPFLTIDFLALVIPGMRRLQSLGVYKCQLINITHGLRLLQILQVDKPRGRENQVHLDWYPNSHQGPDNDIWTGNYGFSWDNLGFDTRIAVWKHVKEIVHRARRQGIDMAARQTSFFKWLQDSPLWKVSETLDTIMDSKTSLAEKVAYINYPLLKGDEREVYCEDAVNEHHGRQW